MPDLPSGPPSGSGESPGDYAAGAEARARARAAAGLPAEQRQLVVVLDWFAPHLDPRVDCELAKSGAACLRIGGGLTNDVQVCDTHRHGPLTSAYRRLESRESERQLRLRPKLAMPTFGRQHVTTRSMQAWAETSLPVDGRKEWVHNALSAPASGWARPQADIGKQNRCRRGRREPPQSTRRVAAGRSRQAIASTSSAP